jgi:hypothetical protein
VLLVAGATHRPAIVTAIAREFPPHNYSRTCHNARYCHRLAVLTVHQQDRTRLCSRRGYRLGYYICRDAAIGRDRQVPAHLVMRMLIIQCRMMWLLTPDLAARQEPVVDQLQ